MIATTRISDRPRTNERKFIEEQQDWRSKVPLACGDDRRSRYVDSRICNRNYRGGGVRSDSVQRGYWRLDSRCVDQHHQPRTQHEQLGADAGFATVEAALAIATLVATLLLCAAGISALATQIQCVDAAREAARLAARGDEIRAIAAAQRVGPRGGRVSIRREGDYIVGRVDADIRLLPGIRAAAEAVAVVE